MLAEPFSPLDIILSCTVCRATLSTIYSSEGQNEESAPDVPDSTKGIKAKLWLTECAHLVCWKHFNGHGGF